MVSRRTYRQMDSDLVESLAISSSTPVRHGFSANTSGNSSNGSMLATDEEAASWRLDSNLSDTASQQQHNITVNSLLATTETLTKLVQEKDGEIAELKAALDGTKKELDNVKKRLDATKDKKIKIDRDLSELVRKVYSSFESEKKFVLWEEFRSARNQATKAAILECAAQSASSYTGIELNHAIKSMFTTHKRLKNESEKENNTAGYKRKITSRRNHLFQARVRASKANNVHVGLMNDLTNWDMSDHEDGELNKYTVKKPAWRDAITDKALADLDKLCTLQKVERLPGTPSKRSKK